MRSMVVVLLFAACASAPPPTAQAPARPCPAPEATAPPVATAPAADKPVQAPDLDVDGIKQRSHAFYDAMDRFDADTIEGLLAPGFAFYSEARFSNAKLLMPNIRAQVTNRAPARTRVWRDEQVFRSGDVATFIGEATVHFPKFGDVPEHDTTGYFTLVWVRGAKWQVVHAQWDRRDQNAEKDRWNDWLVTGTFNRQPNQLLVDTVKGRKPGKALDIAMGQGRNAIFLASQGWKTTGVDIADEGIRLAKEEAARRKLKLEAIEADVDTWDMGTNKWDLIALIYAGADPKRIEDMKKAIKKGGLVVIEYFAVENEAGKKTGAGGFIAGELAAAFKDGFTILKDEIVEDKPDWGPVPKMKLQRFVAQRR